MDEESTKGTTIIIYALSLSKAFYICRDEGVAVIIVRFDCE